MVKPNQMGARLPEVSAELANLAILAPLYGVLAMWRYRPVPGGGDRDTYSQAGTVPDW